MDGRASASYEYAFNEKNKLTQTLEYLYDFDDGDNYSLTSECL